MGLSKYSIWKYIFACYLYNTFGGLHFQETKDGWISKELPGVCSGCKRETFKYICCKAFKQPYCFECWFECNNKFVDIH